MSNYQNKGNKYYHFITSSHRKTFDGLSMLVEQMVLIFIYMINIFCLNFRRTQ